MRRAAHTVNIPNAFEYGHKKFSSDLKRIRGGASRRVTGAFQHRASSYPNGDPSPIRWCGAPPLTAEMLLQSYGLQCTQRTDLVAQPDALLKKRKRQKTGGTAR